MNSTEEGVKPIEEETPPKNAEIDKMTLALLMNRDQYRKYVSSTEPEKHEHINKWENSLNDHKNAILNMTTQLLNDPHLQITNNVNDAFTRYTKVLVNHLEQKKIEKQNLYNQADEDTMFGTIDEEHSTPSTPSFWGATRVSKQPSRTSKKAMELFMKPPTI